MAVRLNITLTENSQNIAENSSNVTMRIYAISTSGSYNNNAKSGTAKLNGKTYSFSSSFKANTTTLLKSITANIPHNADGTKTVASSATYNTGVSSGTISASKSLTLKVINRISQLGVIQDFTVENGVTVPATQYGSADTLNISIGSQIVASRSEFAGGSLVIFTSDELSTIYNILGNSSSGIFSFQITSASGNSNVVTATGTLLKGAFIKQNGVYKKGQLFVKQNGVYKRAVPFVKQGGIYK